MSRRSSSSFASSLLRQKLSRAEIEELLSDQCDKHTAEVEKRLAVLNGSTTTGSSTSIAASIPSALLSALAKANNSAHSSSQVNPLFPEMDVPEMMGMSTASSNTASRTSFAPVASGGTSDISLELGSAIQVPQVDGHQALDNMDLNDLMGIVSDQSLSTLALGRMADDIKLLLGDKLKAEQKNNDVDQTDEVFSSVSTHNQKKQLNLKVPKKSALKKTKKKSKKEVMTEKGDTELDKISEQESVPLVAQKACPVHDKRSSTTTSSSSSSGTTLSMSDGGMPSDTGMPITKNFVKFNRQAAKPAKKHTRKGHFQKMMSTIKKCAKRASRKQPDFEYKLGETSRSDDSSDTITSAASDASSVGEVVAQSMLKDLKCPKRKNCEAARYDDEEFNVFTRRKGNCPQHGSRARQCSKTPRRDVLVARQPQHQPSKFHKKLRKTMKKRKNAARQLAKKIKRKDKEFFCLW